jgi:hypothetical protein
MKSRVFVPSAVPAAAWLFVLLVVCPSNLGMDERLAQAGKKKEKCFPSNGQTICCSPKGDCSVKKGSGEPSNKEKPQRSALPSGKSLVQAPK